jgi:hypothetical protein
MSPLDLNVHHLRRSPGSTLIHDSHKKRNLDSKPTSRGLARASGQPGGVSREKDEKTHLDYIAPGYMLAIVRLLLAMQESAQRIAWGSIAG